MTQESTSDENALSAVWTQSHESVVCTFPFETSTDDGNVVLPRKTSESPLAMTISYSGRTLRRNPVRRSPTRLILIVIASATGQRLPQRGRAARPACGAERGWPRE